MENVSSATGWQQVAEAELVYKTKIKPSERPQIRTSQDIYELLKHTWQEDKIELVEQCKVLLLNLNSRVLGIIDLSTGGTCRTIVDTKLLYMAAIKGNASRIVVAHNHPSGSLKPSKHDEMLTQKIKKAGEYLDIELLDHVIITSEGYFSFADEGLL